MGMTHEATNTSSSTRHSRACSGFFVGFIYVLERDMKVYLLMRAYIKNNWRGDEELLQVYRDKKKAQEKCDAKNAYTPLGRTYDYFIRAKRVTE